jgi:hypothetical protein
MGFDQKNEEKLSRALKAIGWVQRYWRDRQDWYIEWTAEGKRMSKDLLNNMHDVPIELDDADRECLAFMVRYFGLDVQPHDSC